MLKTPVVTRKQCSAEDPQCRTICSVQKRSNLEMFNQSNSGKYIIAIALKGNKYIIQQITWSCFIFEKKNITGMIDCTLDCSSLQS